MRRLPLLLSVLLLGAGLSAGCAGPPLAGGDPAVRDAVPDEPPPPSRRGRLRWPGISDERPPWLRDLPERIERYPAPENATRAGLEGAADRPPARAAHVLVEPLCGSPERA
jgi:hypothetical protein